MGKKQEYINEFIEKIDWSKVVDRWNLAKTLPNRFEYSGFQSYWRQNFRQRPGQALINIGLIPDGIQSWDDTPQILLETCHKD